jgi:hypothetical protein
MKNITPLDDFPIHQTSETLSVPSTTDRNFYDRYWFNGLVKKKISYLRLELAYIQIGTLLMVISVFHLKENNIHFMHPKD